MNINLHQGQLKIFHDPHKYRVVVCGRRFGKSRLVLWELILASLGFPGTASRVSPERVLGVLPTLAQARKILWEPLINVCTETEIAKYVKNISKTEYRIEFEAGKPSIVIAGALDHGGDRLRGMRLYFVACDEVQDYRNATFDEVITPAMADTPGSRAILTGTPKGYNNVLYTLSQRAETLPDLYSFHNMPTATNPTIPRVEIENARLILPPRTFRQEYFASFEDPLGKVFSELDDGNQVQANPEMMEFTVMGVDWGDTNPAFVVWGYLAGSWYFLEAYNPNTGQPVAPPEQDSHIIRLTQRYQPRATFCDPSRPASILHLRNLGQQHQIPGLTKAIAGYNRIEDGLDQVHSLIFQKKLMFPQDTVVKYPGHTPGTSVFRMFSDYHRATDKNGQVTDKVAEGQNDHVIDASRYCLARKKPKE